MTCLPGGITFVFGCVTLPSPWRSFRGRAHEMLWGTQRQVRLGGRCSGSAPMEMSRQTGGLGLLQLGAGADKCHAPSPGALLSLGTGPQLQSLPTHICFHQEM